jgi:hypothetical protein
MLVTQKLMPQLKRILSTYELHEFRLQSTIDFELDDLVDVSDETIETDEMEIDKLYLCL